MSYTLSILLKKYSLDMSCLNSDLTAKGHFLLSKHILLLSDGTRSSIVPDREEQYHSHKHLKILINNDDKTKGYKIL